MVRVTVRDQRPRLTRQTRPYMEVKYNVGAILLQLASNKDSNTLLLIQETEEELGSVSQLISDTGYNRPTTLPPGQPSSPNSLSLNRVVDINLQPVTINDTRQ
jgi:hypothetical protein